MPATYDNSSVYNKYASDCENCGGNSTDCGCGTSSDDCGCCPVGTIAVYDHCGKHLGCLTPNDADKFVNAKLEVPEGYVKVFHPTTGDYMGALPPAQAIELLNFLNGDGVVAVVDPSFNVFSPAQVGGDTIGLTDGFFIINVDNDEGITPEISITIDRVNMNEAVAVSITGTVEDIQYDPSGTTLYMASDVSELTVAFVWTGLSVGPNPFNLTLTSSTVTRTIPFILMTA
jgi:hypothetical protein